MILRSIARNALDTPYTHSRRFWSLLLNCCCFQTSWKYEHSLACRILSWFQWRKWELELFVCLQICRHKATALDNVLQCIMSKTLPFWVDAVDLGVVRNYRYFLRNESCSFSSAASLPPHEHSFQAYNRYFFDIVQHRIPMPCPLYTITQHDVDLKKLNMWVFVSAPCFYML